MINPLMHALRHRNRLKILLFLFALAGAGTTAYRIWRPETPPAATTRWFPVAPQLLETRLGLVGRIRPADEITIAAPFDGMINTLPVSEEQRVEAGQELAVMDATQLDIQLRQAKAELLKADQVMENLRNWDNGPDVARARRALNAAKTTLAHNESALNDTRELFRRGIVARMEVDTLMQQVQSQRQDLVAAQEEMRAVIGKGRGEDRQIAGMEQANAQSRYRLLQAMYERRTITAPFAGFILKSTQPETGKPAALQPGVQVSQGTPLFRLIQADRLQVAARVEETDLHRLRENMPVLITGDGFAGTVLNGHIASLGIQADTRDAGAYYDVIVAVDTPVNPHQPPRLGMTAQLAVMVYRNEQGFAVPENALHADETGVWVNYRRDLHSPPQRINVTTGNAVVQGIEVFGLAQGYVEALP
ncbi:HlyD family secretion protein [Musicola keenii]|uniref:HlyD family secretion protein n=1 Tax=Musicola keenii TaxID=2884250 RepID=UPI0017825305|nr:HlyD family efflux transporter periplasmic adaptor subunit [Musicola keenii]